MIAAADGVTGMANVTVTATTGNMGPTVAQAASASPSTVTGTSTILSVLGADMDGEKTLKYTWADPPAVKFSVNGSNAAKTTKVTFSQAGTYNFTVTIKDKHGLTVTSSVSVTVVQTATKLKISPSNVFLHSGETQQFTATEFDQFGNAMNTQPTINWGLATDSSGSIDSNGLYTSTTDKYGGMAIVTVSSSDGLTGTANVNVGPQPILLLRPPSPSLAFLLPL